MERTIRIACETKDHAELDRLKPLQGELKSLSKDGFNRLKREILETGFAFPIYVWHAPEGWLSVVGGHQRVRVLQTLRSEGYKVPPVPIVFVHAATEQEAKRRVLQDVSQYGTVEKQGLYEFMEGAQLSIEELEVRFDIPDVKLDMDSFRAEYFEESSGGDGNGDSEPKKLSERFLIPPFSVMNARQGWWQDRKRQWLELGIQSELGRGGAPGGSPRPAAQLTANGRTMRGDGRGREL